MLQLNDDFIYGGYPLGSKVYSVEKVKGRLGSPCVLAHFLKPGLAGVVKNIFGMPHQIFGRTYSLCTGSTEMSYFLS